MKYFFHAHCTIMIPVKQVSHIGRGLKMLNLTILKRHIFPDCYMIPGVVSEFGKASVKWKMAFVKEMVLCIMRQVTF